MLSNWEFEKVDLTFSDRKIAPPRPIRVRLRVIRGRVRFIRVRLRVIRGRVRVIRVRLRVIRGRVRARSRVRARGRGRREDP